MLTPELKTFDSADVDDLLKWVPDTDEVLYWLNLEIGLPGAERADHYQVAVATPAGLKPHRGMRARSGAWQPIVVRPYSWKAVLAEVERRLLSCSGADWHDVNQRLRAQFQWEYEGMTRSANPPRQADAAKRRG